MDTPHHLRFTRSLALGAAFSLLATACESNRETNFSQANQSANSGNAAATDSDVASVTAATTSADDAGSTSGSSAQNTASAAQPPHSGNTCATLGQHVQSVTGAGDREVCRCADQGGGSLRWTCFAEPMRVMGPLPPPELTA